MQHFTRFLVFWLLLWPGLSRGQLGQWATVQMSPSVPMTGIQIFEDGQTGWAVGGNSVGGLFHSALFHTTNGGNTWQTVAFPFASATRLQAVHFPSAQKGWVVGETGKIYHTPDGGQTWTSQASGTNRDLASVHFIDEQTGWAVGGWQDGTSYLVLKTTNGGATWQDLSFGSNAFSVSDVWFVNEDHGWITARKNTLAPVVWHTDDGGATWEEQATPLSASNIDLPSIQFTSERNGWMVTSSLYFPGSVLHTTDGGETWEIVTQTGHAYNVLAVRDSLSVAVAGVNILTPASEKILVTTDGGLNWASYTPPFLHYSWGISFVGSGIWFAGNGSAILHSADQGLNWELQHYSPLLNSIDWSDDDSGWATAGYVLGVQKYWTRSEDDGDSWIVDLSLPNASDIQWIDSQNGWALFESNNATFWRTTNGGVNWSPTPIGTSNWTGGFYFTDHDHGWAFGSNGNVRGTLNGGMQWFAQNIGSTYYTQKAYFLDPYAGWAGGGFGGAGFIAHTTDGGATWIDQTPGANAQVMDIFFLDKTIGWACSTSGYIQKTTDGGSSWQVTTQLPHPFTERIFFLDTLQGWVTARNGIGSVEDGKGFIYHTQDGGSTWSLQWTGIWPASAISDLRLEKDSTALWAVGQHGTILKYQLMEEPSSTSGPLAATGAALLPALPNPFAGTVQLQFALPEAGPATLQVYDLSGRLLEQWHNERWPAGTNAVVWSAPYVPPGFYLVRLESRQGVATQKLVKSKS